MKRELIRIEVEDNGSVKITKYKKMSWYEVLGLLIHMKDFVREIIHNKPQQPIIINNDILKGKKN